MYVCVCVCVCVFIYLYIAHFRVKYPKSMLSNIQKAIKAGDDRFNARDRIGLQDDAFALTGAGLMSIADLLELISCYKNEKHFTVWQDLSKNLGTLRKNNIFIYFFCLFVYLFVYLFVCLFRRK